MVFSYKNRNFIHKSYHDFKILNSSKDKYMFPYCTTDAKHHVHLFIPKIIDHNAYFRNSMPITFLPQ